MGCAEGPPGQHRPARVPHSRHGPDPGTLQRLRPAQIRQNGGQAFCQHGFPCPRGANHQQVVPSGGGDLQRPLYILLSHHIPEVRQSGLIPLRLPHWNRREERLSPEMGRQRFHILYAVNRQPAGQSGLSGILRRDE